jgi:serine/threonine protein kinase
MKAVKRVAETIPMAICEGRVVNISGHPFLVVKGENSALDIYMLDKTRSVGSGGTGTARQVFSLIGHTWGKVIKMPHDSRDMPDIENGVKMVALVNPDGKTRGCIKTPYLVRENVSDSDGQSVMRGALMRSYDSDALNASEPNGILDLLHHNCDCEPYYVDMVHQALSVLAKLQEAGVAHTDIKAANILVSRGEDGFIDFHLGDWDNAYTPEPGSNSREVPDTIKMGLTLSSLIPYKNSPFLQGIIPQMLSKECNIGRLLDEFNQMLDSKAKTDSSPLWQNVARRAGIRDQGPI